MVYMLDGRRFRRVLSALVVAVTVAATHPCTPLHAAEPAAFAKARTLSSAFRAAAEKVKPTVVQISTVTKPRASLGGSGDSPSDNPFKGTPLENLFGENARRFRFGGPPITQREGVGSGVILDEGGVILTNNHVVAGVDEVRVEMMDGRQFTATEIRGDPRTDLALLWVDSELALPFSTLGDSSELETGDWVLAIGSPFGLEQTVSAGIISGKGRTLRNGKGTEFLQTDAAINPGNSGGPLVNLDGEVVGINTAIASSSGGYQGIGFAVPSNLAKWVKNQLVSNGSVQRCFLGVGAEKVTPNLADKLGLASKRGVLVSEVFRETPAEKAGVRPGDVILAFAGLTIDSPRRLQEAVERLPSGSKQELGLFRDGKSQSLQVVVAPLPDGYDSAL